MFAAVVMATSVVFSAAMSAAAEPAAQFERPSYAIHRAAGPITIDGRLDEADWFAAPRFPAFQFPWHTSGEREQTVAKMLWDDDYVYVAHVCQDAHITARHTERDGPIAQDDCFEVMVAPNPERPDFYYNIEWNVLGGFVDNHRPQGATGPREAWDSEGVQVVGRYVGTLNQDDDRDGYWLVEAAIPLKNFAHAMPHMPPEPGDAWHLNFNRHGGDTNLQYSQWAPGDTPQPAFHTPHRFGRVVFSAATCPFETDKQEN